MPDFPSISGGEFGFTLNAFQMIFIPKIYLKMMCKRVFVFAVACCCVSIGHAANISFADSKVKALCVQHWDSNKDGELSTEEAAAVTSLGTVFRGNTSIGTFDELSYFTGLTAIDEYAFNGSSLRNVTLPSTVTEIGENAFCGTKLSGELRVPGTVKNIGNYAFYSCTLLTAIILEEGVETVGYYCFSGPIRTFSLPSTLKYIGPSAIDPYVNAGSSSGIFLPEGDLYVYVHSDTPAAINAFAFYYLNGAGHLVVPFGAKDAYKEHSGWSVFKEYLEYGDVNMDGEINVKDVVAVSSHIMGNKPSPFNALCADTNGDGDVNVKDVVGISNYIMQK